jgi:hypothetical protein
MKVHLLDPHQDFPVDAELPPTHQDLVKDLELEPLLNAMADGDRFLLDVARKVLLTSVEEPSTIQYRQQVFRDCLTDPDIVRSIYAVAVAVIDARKGLWWHTSQNPSLVLSSAVNYLDDVLGRLRELRRLADEHMTTVQSPGLRQLFHTLQEELDDDYLRNVAAHLRELRFPAGVLMSAELAWDNSGINFVLRRPERGRRGWMERLAGGRRASYAFTVPPRDEAGNRALEEMSNRAINLVANAAAQSADHVANFFAALRWELGFYVGGLNLYRHLREAGVAVTFPEPLPRHPARLAFAGLTDVSLALTSGAPVVGNEATADGRRLCIITGANSGGKSTFLRSVGQAHLMMQCGLFVAADTFSASVRSGVFTHFLRDEDETLESGRLDEELRRLSGLVDHLRPHALVLFNESFAGTNEREGSEIARQVITALLDASMTVFFVTHQFTLAEHFLVHHPDTTLFLRAERGGDQLPSYRLVVAPPLPTSYGEDLYWKWGAWLDDDLPGNRKADVDAT